MVHKDSFYLGYGSEWNDVFVKQREGYSTSVTDYHEHEFYELNLIFSGNVKILLGDSFQETTEPCVVLTPPHVPHYVACKPDTLYRRLYLVFTHEFVAEGIPEWNKLLSIFGKCGAILPVGAEQAERLRTWIEQIREEASPLRRRLLVYYLLSLLTEQAGSPSNYAQSIPPYLVEVLHELETHYGEHLVAAELAKKMHVGRTTLLTEFKRHTGNTLGEYLTHCRLRHACQMLREGKTVESTAERCGFADSSGLIRAFKRAFDMSPRQYVKQAEESSLSPP